MKRLLLVSMLQEVTEKVREAAPDLAGGTVIYIPTAGKVEPHTEGMVEAETTLLQSLGLTVEVLDVSTVAPETIAESFAQSAAIFVGGGNTFYLLQELRRSGALTRLRAEIASGKWYIGESAGAVIACPDIGYCAEMDDPSLAPELDGDYAALGVVDFTLVPHIGNAYMGEAAEAIRARRTDDAHLIAITDRELVRVLGDEVTVL